MSALARCINKLECDSNFNMNQEAFRECTGGYYFSINLISYNLIYWRIIIVFLSLIKVYLKELLRERQFLPEILM